MSRIDAIDEAIATTSAVRSIAAWGNSSDPDQLATYCQRRATADGAQVILARHLGAGSEVPQVQHLRRGPTMRHLIKARNDLRSQASRIRRSSASLAGDALRNAQDQHRALMARITQLNEAIRNH